MFGVNPYQRIAGVGPTVDNLREYLLTLYARAYDAIDRHLIFGAFEERKYTPQEIKAVAARFDLIIDLLKRVGDLKGARAVQRLKTITVKHMRDELDAKAYVRELKKILKSYGIKTPEIERIERKIDMLEARLRERARRPQAPNIFAQLDRALNRLAAPRGRAPHQARRRPRPVNPFAQLDRIMTRLTQPPRRRGRRRR